MKQEVTVTGKTVEAAVELGAEQLGTDTASVTYEVIEAPKKGFLGIGEAPAKVKVCFTPSPEKVGLEFVRTVIRDMDLEADASLAPVEGAKREYIMTIEGPDASALIGHHGETLDSLQYLVNLAANRRDEEDEGGNYTRISLDIENYRAKREETLRRLARRMAEKAVRYRRNISFEPMNSYERRIIHSELQSFSGVTTGSVGLDSNRRVVIYVNNPMPKGQRKDHHRKADDCKPAAVQEDDKEIIHDPEEDIDSDLAENISYYSTYSSEPKAAKIQKRARFDDTLPEYHTGDALKDGYSDDTVE